MTGQAIRTSFRKPLVAKVLLKAVSLDGWESKDGHQTGRSTFPRGRSAAWKGRDPTYEGPNHIYIMNGASIQGVRSIASGDEGTRGRTKLELLSHGHI